MKTFYNIAYVTIQLFVAQGEPLCYHHIKSIKKQQELQHQNNTNIKAFFNFWSFKHLG